MSQVLDASTDFFISYHNADAGWASWIAWQLEQAGFTTILQAWDFRPGSNFVLEMQNAARVAKRTIAVLSPNYLASSFAQPEWAAAFAQDPTGLRRRLIPVLVEDCDASGLLGPIVHINLVGLGDERAAGELLAGIQPGRAKPKVPPSFPGSEQPRAKPAQPGSTTLRFEPTTVGGPVVWRSDTHGRRWVGNGGPTLIEVHLVPVGPAPRLTVRQLDDLQRTLTDIGRQAGVFSRTQELQSDASEQWSAVTSARSRGGDEAGLVVTRIGQRGCWLTLPHDTLGSVFDPAELQPRLASMLRLLMDLPIEATERAGFALALRSTTMLMEGKADVIGRRNSSSGRLITQDVEVGVEDSVSVAAITHHADDIADDLIARLAARLRRGP